jgi:CubicO group peptidase (beta-lactamase class C family)
MPFYAAVAQATEEAVMVANEEMLGADGHRVPALPRERVVTLLRERGVTPEHTHTHTPTDVGRRRTERAAMDREALGRTVDEIFERLNRRGDSPGIAYGVVVDGDLVHRGASGMRRAGLPILKGGDVLSRICSMTKSFVAAAAMILRDEGHLELDAPIAEYVPELRHIRPPTTDSDDVRVRSLLTMSAGFPSDDPWADRYMDLDRASVDAIFERVGTFSSPPGSMFEYSNLGWVMIGRALSNIVGGPVQRFINDQLLEPLGMSSTTWDVPDDERRWWGHRWQDGMWQEEDRPLADGDWAPMAGLWSTVPDLASWITFFMDAFPSRNAPDNGPLSRRSRREMQRIHQVAPADDPPDAPVIAGYGYGLWVEADAALGDVVGHRGGLPGFGSHMRWLPERGIGVIALANGTYAPMHAATLGVLRQLDASGLLPQARGVEVSQALSSARDALLRLLTEWDDELAAQVFSKNVALDDPLDRRRNAAADVRRRLGSIGAGSVRVRTATSGSFEIHGDAGRCFVDVTLTPEVPPRIATYRIEYVGDRL